MRNLFRRLCLATLTVAFVSCNQPQHIGPLPSWNDTAAREAIIDYVQSVTRRANPHFIPEAERVAVFDNDGTLWAEQPFSFQIAFALNRLERLAPQHPEWAEDEDLANALSGDPARLGKLGQRELVKVVQATHSGMSNQEFREMVRAWMTSASHPTTGRPFSHLIYQPMRELLDYLRMHDFDVYIVAGGGREFMRAFAEEVYGVPPEKVIGSLVVLEYSAAGDAPVLHRLPDIAFVNDGPGKPIGIQHAIGRRPVFAFGNSDGDQQMLQWTDASPHLSLQGLVHHTDAGREWAYDRESPIGHLDKALDEALQEGWIVVDMRADWKTVFPPED